MRRLVLAPTAVTTSRLGFGCVRLTTHPTRSEAVRMLEHVFSLGITHFDVARAYGFGRAEGILGEFLRGKRRQVTVATKFGLQPPSGVAGSRLVIDLMKKVLGPFPSLLQRARNRGASLTTSGVFTAQAAVQSLETSLRELQTDYIDILLLHEATAANAANADMVQALQKQVELGKVRALGIGSSLDKLEGKTASLPALYQVLQFENNASQRNVPKIDDAKPRGLITHSVFQPSRALAKGIQSRPDTVRKYSAQLNVDLRDQEVVCSWLLRYALSANPAGVVLFASTVPEHATNNARQEELTQREVQQFAQFVDEILSSSAVLAGGAPQGQAAS